MNELGYECGLNGIFEFKTQACVKKFQDEYSLSADGRVGPLTWQRLFKEIPPNEPSSATLNVLEALKSRTDVYRQPTNQDLVGRGIFTQNEPPERSERIYPAYVLGPRRQVDSLVRQLHDLLPAKDTAFLLTERLVQYPEEYLPYLLAFEKAVLLGSFVGIGKPQPPEYPDWAKRRHDTEFWRLEQCIQLLQAMNRDISALSYTMGDSPSLAAVGIRESLQKRLDDVLERYSLSHLKQRITWGADEVVAMAFAQTLPLKKVRVRISNPEAQHHYDGMRKSQEVIAEKLPAVGLIETEDTDWDFEVAFLTRRIGGSVDNYQSNDSKQADFDRHFLYPYQSYSSEQRSKLAMIDGRLFNGAWDTCSVLPRCDLLAYGSWGTFGNVVGATLATAKILFSINHPTIQRQLYLEAVAHDVFANGYQEAQRGGLRDKLRDVGITFNHYEGYQTQETVTQVFNLLNQHVNERMQQHFADTICLQNRVLRFTPQLWRTFESEVHIWPRIEAENFQPGVFRKDLDIRVFNPLSNLE